MSERFKYWEWDDTVGAVFLLLVVSVVSLVFIAISQDHSIRFYYLSNGGKAGTCVSGHREWTGDSEGVFCSADSQTASAAANQFNQVLAAGKGHK